ncbi:MAG TPA: M48 family metalloprotease [Planctomycetota bacterium]
MAWFVGTLFALAFAVLAPACWRAGRGRVSRWRCLCVAAALAAGTAAPALPALLAGGSFLRGHVTSAVVPEGVGHDGAGTEGTRFDPDRQKWEHVVEQPDGSPDFFVMVVIWIALLNTASQCLRLPRHLGHLQQLPPVSEPALVERIHELAARLGLRSPLVVQPATVGGTMEVQAFAAGLLAPVVVVSDGIVHRLSAAECSAVLAHELAHVRHRSVLRYLAALTLVSIAAVLLSGFMPFHLALLWWFTAFRLLRTLVGHRDEVQADLAAARCVGFAEVAAALDKIHAAGLQVDPSPWFHAVLSHPAPAVRAFHLANAAPERERARIAVDTALVRRCRRVRRIAVLVWVVLLAAQVLLAVQGQGAASAVLGAVLLALPLLPYLAFVRELRDTLQLHGWSLLRGLRRTASRVTALIAAAAGPLALLQWTPADSWLVWLPFALAFAGVLLVALAGRGARRGYRELKLRLLQRDLAGYLECHERLKPRWRRHPAVSLQALLVRAALGERQAAVQGLQQLQRQWPRFREARLWEVVLTSRLEPRRAVGLARELLAALPGNAFAEGVLATTLRRAGEVEEAWQRIENVLRRRPKHGQWHAAAALIAFARGDRDTALAELAKAERLDPGGSITVLARAELDVETGAATAAASVQRLREVCDRLPLAFLGDDLARLEGRVVRH